MSTDDADHVPSADASEVEALREEVELLRARQDELLSLLETTTNFQAKKDSIEQGNHFVENSEIFDHTDIEFSNPYTSQLRNRERRRQRGPNLD